MDLRLQALHGASVASDELDPENAGVGWTLETNENTTGCVVQLELATCPVYRSAAFYVQPSGMDGRPPRVLAHSRRPRCRWQGKALLPIIRCGLCDERQSRGRR